VSSPRAEARAGFSLIEVLASLAIVAALVSAMLPLMRDLLSRWSAGAEQADVADHWMRGVLRLSEDLDQALPAPARTDRPQDADAAFALGPSCLRFMRRSLPGETPGLTLLTYRAARADGSQILVRSAVPLRLNGALAAEEATQSIVLRAVWPMRFKALDASAEPSSKSRDWPRAVALVFETVTGQRQTPEPLVMPIPARSPLSAQSDKDIAKPISRDDGC
jgi:prepilin-type N-terminal cleavage/methylation domain-containing protein